jgi:hypothetical protein
MSNVPILDASAATRKIDVFTRTEGADTVEMQAVAVVEPTTGTPVEFATQTTLAALLVAANAIKAAAEALNTKTTAVNTGAISGTVALDSGSLAALENINVGGSVSVSNLPGTQPVSGTVAVSNMVALGLTDAQLRASALPVSLAAAPTTPVTGTFWQATQPVSAAANLPTSKNATIFQFSTQNTSVAQLAAGATFTGVIETALDQPSISLLLASDQPITLTVRQYIDLAGTRAVPDIVFYIAAGAGFARSFTINGNYVQVLAQNTGASTTTTFSLNTAYGDLGDSDSSGIQPVTELPLVLTGAAAQTATVNNILGPVAGSAALGVSGYRAASVQVTSTATAGTFIFEQSNDGVNWAALPVFNAALVTGVPIVAAITASASSIIYSFPLRCNFVRLRIATTITGGSVQAFSRIGTDPWTQSAQLVASNTAANLLMTATVSGDTAAAASADALANPTIKQIGADAMNFNGTSWDRERNNVNVTVGDTGAKTATFFGATQINYNARGAKIMVLCGTVTGTTPTLTAQLQISPDGGTTWLNFGPASGAVTTTGNTILIDVYPANETVAGATPAALTTGATQTVQINAALPRTWRISYVITGTTPSFTLTNAYAAYTN